MQDNAQEARMRDNQEAGARLVALPDPVVVAQADVIRRWVGDVTPHELAELVAALPALARATTKGLRAGYGMVEARIVAGRVDTPIRIVSSAGEPIQRGDRD